MNEEKLIKLYINKSINLLYKIPGIKRAYKFKIEKSKYGFYVKYGSFKFLFNIPDDKSISYRNISDNIDKFIDQVEKDYFEDYKRQKEQFKLQYRNNLLLLNLRSLLLSNNETLLSSFISYLKKINKYKLILEFLSKEEADKILVHNGYKNEIK